MPAETLFISNSIAKWTFYTT